MLAHVTYLMLMLTLKSLCKPAFNLKTFLSFKISSSKKYGVKLFLLFAKKMQRRHLFWLTLILFNYAEYAVPQRYFLLVC